MAKRLTEVAHSWEERYHLSDAQALYLHIPFCAHKCLYCDFCSAASHTDNPALERYITVALSELQALEHEGLLDSCATAYIGGGTPSLMGERLIPLIQEVRAYCTGEFTSEANPDFVTPELLQEYRKAGLTRISFGVQSTSDQELHDLGRIHDKRTALQALEWGQEVGLTVSADLMCAIPDQTSKSWQTSLKQVLSTGIEHLSVYPLMIEEGTAFGRRYGVEDYPSWNNPDVQAMRMEEAAKVAGPFGFHRYEVASYAKPGYECAHNKIYWTGLPYLGVGCAASGMVTRKGYARLRRVYPQLPQLENDAFRIRLTNTTKIEDYLRLTQPCDLHFDIEALTARQTLAEDLMLACRMQKPLDPILVSYARDELGDTFDTAVHREQAEGLLNERLKPTHQGWLLGNELFSHMWDLAGDRQTQLISV